MDDAPYRLVDATNQGWHRIGGAGIRYAADYGTSRNLPESLTLPEIDATRAPWRPVLPISDEDEAQLVEVFDACKRRTITTIAAALEVVFHDIRASRGGLNNLDSYRHTMRTMLAGREGSWESEVLKGIILFGNTLNLVPPKRGEDRSVEACRKRGPNRRVDVAGRTALAAMFTRWVTDPTRYTEVAETLAGEVSRYADERHPSRGGWVVVADRWPNPGPGDSASDTRACYRLFYSQSQHFDSGCL